MDTFELWLLAHGINTVMAGIILWTLAVEIPYSIVLWRRTKFVRATLHKHLDHLFPPVWNHNPSTEVVGVSRSEWMRLANFEERETLEYKSGVDKFKLVVIVVGVCAVASGNYWLLVLLSVAITSFFQGQFQAAEKIAQQVYDLHEQPWITRNRLLNDTPTSMTLDNLPLDFSGNPLQARDVVGVNTSFHHLEPKK